MIIDNANRCVFSRAVSSFHQSNLHIQLEVPDAVLALQEAVFIFLYGTFLQTRILIEEICKDLRTGFVVAKYLPATVRQEDAFDGRVRTVINFGRRMPRASASRNCFILNS